MLSGTVSSGVQEEEAEQARQEDAKKKKLQRKERKEEKKRNQVSSASEVCNPEHLISAGLATAWDLWLDKLTAVD